MRRAFSGAEHRIADPGRSCQRLSIAQLECGSDVVPLRKSIRRRLGVTQPARLGVLDSVHVAIGDVQPGAEPSAVKFESLCCPIPAACGIDSSL